eukprot:scaffold8397_cov90-Cylindrotheca_fusiformis.AAC.5
MVKTTSRQLQDAIRYVCATIETQQRKSFESNFGDFSLCIAFGASREARMPIPPNDHRFVPSPSIRFKRPFKAEEISEDCFFMESHWHRICNLNPAAYPVLLGDEEEIMGDRPRSGLLSVRPPQTISIVASHANN